MDGYTVRRYLWQDAARQEFTSGRCYELYLFLRGTAVFRCAGADLPAGQEELIIFKPGEAGTLVFPGTHAPLEFIRVQLTNDLLAALSDETTDLAAAFNVVPFRQIAVRADNSIYMLLKNLAGKLLELPDEASEFGAALFERGLLQMFVVLALRTCIRAERHRAPAARRHLMIDEVFVYIRAHLDEELTLERLEKQFYVSRAHLSREFKRRTGQTIHRYIVKARLDRCRGLIEQGYPITEVYRMGGFGDYNHFFRAFKQEYGMTPKEYYRTTNRDAHA